MTSIINKKKSWDFIKEICNYCETYNIDLPEESFNYYYRSPEVDSEYKRWKQEKHNLLNTLFSDNQGVSVRPNDFPYHFESGLIHYIVWLNPNYFDPDKISPRMTKIVKDYVTNVFNISSNNYEWVYFRNSPNNRTISYIPHYHVVVKLQ